jgi:asparagine synthase (glutamine-hydrolysing)
MGPSAAADGLRKLDSVTPRFTSRAPESDWAKMCVLESCCYMKNMLLRDSDWAGMAHGLEIRVPLVDRGVFDLVSRRLATHRPLTKGDLQQLSAKPAGVGTGSARKRGFALPMRNWLTGSKVPGGGGVGSRLWAANVARSLGCNLLERRAA